MNYSVTDTHEWHEYMDIPKGDVFLHCGDVLFSNSQIFDKSNEETINLIKKFNIWLGKLPHKYKIVIGGNHDYAFIESKLGTEKVKKLLFNCEYIMNESFFLKLNNNKTVHLYGSPYSIANSQWSQLFN